MAIELAASRMQSMTVTELRDRLDDRFRLLVGSRRRSERHQTLRQAVAWSYDLLDDAEKTLLARCSVFSGGFDLAAACAVGGCGDDLATLDVLDALVRKSLLVADRSTGRTRFSMLETIRQFAEEQLVTLGEATAARTAHARHFAGREADVLTLWDSPRQRDAHTWLTTELPSTTATMPRPRGVTATTTSTGFAVAQWIVQTSGTAFTGLRTLTGNPSRKKITKQCPAAMASALRVASSTNSASLPVRRTSRGPDASQKASPNRSDALTPTNASCRSSTVLMKCACPITTLTPSGLSTDTTSQDNDVVVTHPCCHRHPTATSHDQNVIGLVIQAP